MLDLTNQLKNRFIFYLGRDGWKPIQVGIQLSTSTVLNLFDDLVVNGNYQYLMTG